MGQGNPFDVAGRDSATGHAFGQSGGADAEHAYAVGIDFGTLSGRALIVRISDGAEVGTAVHEYTHGVMDETLATSGAPLPPEWALQVPSDYVDVLKNAVPKALAASGVPVEQVVGIGTAFTACTVLPTADDGTPLNELEAFRDRPHAYVKLWRHHAAQPHADRINALAHERGEPWINRYGGKLSSEWEFAKGLQLFEEDPETYGRMDHWVEAADWIVWQLTGVYVRNACTAGYKAVRQDGQYPDEDFLSALGSGFGGFVRDKVERPIVDLGERVGSLTAEAAGWTGLPQGIAVCAGNVDAHVTAPAARVVEPGRMLAVMGTSTCHVMSSDVLAGDVPGMCGVVDGGIVPGLWGYEAGQSGVGDIFAWFVDHSVPPYVYDEAERAGVGVHELLTDQASRLAVGEAGLVALDWHSGNRSVLVDHELSGLIVGTTLATQPHEVYRTLLEATAFGTRRIIAGFEDSGVPVNELVIAGGLLKNELLMQIYADVTGKALSIIDSEQGPALGSAMHAAVAAGAYPDIHAAAHAMGKAREAVYTPDEDAAAAYDELYAEYERLHDHFGQGENNVMRRLKAMRRRVVSA
ncbi:ribulokinase [Egibacter rhizosphaerae]|uniref:Ribulokinase n=1 Tax=Egibacter rhizosphaerae TaxID=1670831 RepID=A0A411YB04_9ACTN|nr:ribulokinase [Egibacter rhizosphaerae]QBI18358.1 ribulokinase [Egibacter rhizosphaerae]